MGKRGQRRPAKKTSGAETETENTVDLAAEALASMFRPIPQNMRNELNGVVEKLLHLVTYFWDTMLCIAIYRESSVSIQKYLSLDTMVVIGIYRRFSCRWSCKS